MIVAAEEQKPVPRYAVFLAFAYLFVYYTRLQDNVPGLDILPWVGVLFLLFALWGGWVLVSHNGNFFSKPIKLIFWLGVLFAITGVGAISVASYQMSFKWILLTFPQCVALVVVFSSITQLKKLHNFWVVIYSVMAIFTIKNAPLGPGDFSGDPNDAALALGMGIPFAFYALFQPSLTKIRRIFCCSVLLLLLIGIVATSSRGGFLGMVAGLLAIWWMGRSRIKVMLFGLVGVVIGGGILISFIPDSYVEDMQSISDKSDSTRNERIRTWEIGWEMFKANPVLGIGAGNFRNTVHKYQHKTSWWTGEQKSLSGRSAHSLYFQILPELGIVGVLIYGYIMLILPLRLLRIAKRLDTLDANQRQIKLFCQSLIAAMAVYAIAGAFISVAYYPHIPIWLAMYTITLSVIKNVMGTHFLESSRA